MGWLFLLAPLFVLFLNTVIFIGALVLIYVGLRSLIVLSKKKD